jgi:selenium metabolism protein YedF
MSKKEKTILIKSDKIGEGELGSILINGFLKAIYEQDEVPKAIVCINNAVLLTTANEENEVLKTLKQLAEKGVTIYSCGTCLDYYKKRDDLKVGILGNAMDTAKMLLTENIVSL